MTGEQAQKIKKIYQKVVVRLNELLALEKQAVNIYNKKLEDEKIQELKNNIQNK